MAELAFKHLDHEPFTTILDALLEERLDLVRRLAVRRLRELELAVNRLEVLIEQLAAFREVLMQQGLYAGSIPTCDRRVGTAAWRVARTSETDSQ